MAPDEWYARAPVRTPERSGVPLAPRRTSRMRWLAQFRTNRDTTDAGAGLAAVEMPTQATTFSGVRSERGVHPLKGLYEFWTASDTHFSAPDTFELRLNAQP